MEYYHSNYLQLRSERLTESSYLASEDGTGPDIIFPPKHNFLNLPMDEGMTQVSWFEQRSSVLKLKSLETPSLQGCFHVFGFELLRGCSTRWRD